MGALRGGENVAWKGECCVEGGALRGRENVAWKGERCAEGKMLRGRGSVAWKGKCCVEEGALRGRGSVELQPVTSACLVRRMPPARTPVENPYYKHLVAWHRCDA